MIRLPRWSLAALLGVAMLAGSLTRSPGRELTGGTYGVLPTAYGAVYDLLLALDVPVRRSHALSAALPAAATVWWLAPPSLCRDRRAGWQAAEWVRRGGTAVLFLPPADHCPVVDDLAGLVLPARTQQRPPRPAGDATQAAPAGLWHERAFDRDQVLSGALVPRPRDLLSPGLQAFLDHGEWQVRAALDGLPFVVEAHYGAGRLVLVADARVLSNAVLDRGDNAVLAQDLVVAYGAPYIDELEHGVQPSGGALSYLSTSPALPLLAGLCVLAALYAWSGLALPPRAQATQGLPPPSLTAFVDSLAALYATCGDHQRVWQAYRNHSLARLRQHFRWAGDVPSTLLLQRLIEQQRVSAGLASALSGSPLLRSKEDLRQAVIRLDRLVEEAVRS
jgi:hypothetical protein